MACSDHERGVAVAVRPVDAHPALQQLPHGLHLVVGRGGVQHAEAMLHMVAAATYRSISREERADQPPLAQPLEHLLQLSLLRRTADLFRNRSGRAHRCWGTLRTAAGSTRGSGGPTGERRVHAMIHGRGLCDVEGSSGTGRSPFSDCCIFRFLFCAVHSH